MEKHKIADDYLIDKIRNLIKELIQVTDKKEIHLQELADKLSNLLIYVEDNIDVYRREKCKSESKVKTYPIGR